MSQTQLIAGKITLIRRMGSAAYLMLDTDKGEVECHISQDNVTEREFNRVKTWSAGDIVCLHGTHGGVLFEVKTIGLVRMQHKDSDESDSDRYDRAMGVLGL